MFAKITKEDEKAIELAFSNISRKQCKQTRQTLEQLLDNLS
jgi:hypothetical protein